MSIPSRALIVRAIIHLLLTLSIIAQASAAERPPVQLVDVYPGNLTLANYWVSEKYDGVRGYWDGHQMLTRAGSVIKLPAWFTHDLPARPMDGELWAGYDGFATISKLVRNAGPDHEGWHDVIYQVFDLPGPKPFDERIPAIKKVVSKIDQPWVKTVRQFRVTDEKALRKAMDEVVERGGEGLVLHQGSRPYTAGRNAGLYKLKPYQDAEAKVVAYRPGKGRLTGKMGALVVRMTDGRKFAIGTGFSDKLRSNPPAIGSWITFRFQGQTNKGIPRFARFLRKCPGGPPPEAPQSDHDGHSAK